MNFLSFRVARSFTVLGFLVAFAFASGCRERSEFCEPPTGYVPDEGLPPCTSANEGDVVCTYVGPGYECTGGCWAQFYDGACRPTDAGVDAAAGP